MDKRKRFVRPPIYQTNLGSRKLWEGWKFDYAASPWGFEDHCIVCQVSLERLKDLYFELLQESRLLVDAMDLTKDYYDTGGFGFLGCRVYRYDHDGSSTIKEFIDVEFSTFCERLEYYFNRIYSDGHITIEVGPLNEDFDTNVYISLTRDGLIRISVKNTSDLMHFLDVLGKHKIPRNKRLRISDSIWRSYHRCESTQALWHSLLNDFDPKRDRFDRMGFDGDEMPSGI